MKTLIIGNKTKKYDDLILSVKVIKEYYDLHPRILQDCQVKCQMLLEPGFKEIH